MGWLFGKKKMDARVPFPEGRLGDEKTLRFPSGWARERVIEPEQVKAAAGVGKEDFFQEAEEKEEMPLPEVPSPKKTAGLSLPRMSSAPLYVKVEVYQKILGELEGMRSDLLKLQECNTRMQNSEYNEESHFAKLRRFMRGIHDDLLRGDRVLFKA